MSAPTTASPAGLRGDEGELYRRHHQALLRAVARQVNAPAALIEDACQRAWIILLRRQPDREPALFAWLRTVAVREAWALSRTQRRTLALDELTDIDGDESPVLAGPADQLEDALEARRALRALTALPDRQRRYLTRLASGHSYHEIAQAEPRPTPTSTSTWPALGERCATSPKPPNAAQSGHPPERQTDHGTPGGRSPG